MKYRDINKLFIITSAAILFGGCSGGTQKAFSKTTRLEMQPYISHADTLVSDIRHTSENTRVVYLKRYLPIVEIQAYRSIRKQVIADLQMIVTYSRGLVEIGRSQNEQHEKVTQYSQLLEELVFDKASPIAPQSSGEMEAVRASLVRVSEEENLIDALNAALPLVGTIAESGYTGMMRSDESRKIAFNTINHAITERYREAELLFEQTLDYRKVLTTEKRKISDYFESGQQGGVSFNTAILKRIGLGKESGKSVRSVKRVDRAVMEQLTASKLLMDNVELELALMRKELDELDSLNRILQQLDMRLKKAISTWETANKRLAAGVTEPAELFDLADPGDELIGLARDALTKLL